jgi:hypothetical protein
MTWRRKASGEPWARWRLQATVVAVAVGCGVGLFGVGYAVVVAARSVAPPHMSSTSTAAAAAGLAPGQVRRDAIAAAAMVKVEPGASRGGTPAATAGPTLTVPAATSMGAQGVPSGFPHTGEGAIGQLAAIESMVLESMSVPTATAVYQGWSAPGAPAAATWDLTGAIEAFLGSAAGQYADEATTVVRTTPAAGQVKGDDGPDWVVACVLMDVKAAVVTTSRIAYGHCERMTWSTTDQRWLIGPGQAPALAPSMWPGTELAIAAGWRSWITTGQ